MIGAMSRLGLFCEKLLEAGWLAAVILAPLFFNVYSSRVFEPDKISLVRSLALVMLAAWLIRRLEGVHLTSTSRTNGASVRTFLLRARATVGGWSQKNPFTIPTLIFITVYLISTLGSLSPSISLLGSYQRLQGLYTTLSYVVIFFLAASTIRSKTQIDRAISVTILVSFPVAAYGVIQHYFLDPLPWGGDVTARVASNMGNSIFVAAYLVMVLPLTLGRLVGEVRRSASELAPTGSTRSLETGMGAWLSILGPRAWLYAGIVVSFLTLAIAWGFSFEFGAKRLIEAGYNGTVTPEMLAASATDFYLALGVTFLVMSGWWAAAALQKKRVISFLLLGIYTLMLAVQSVTIMFTQSRGPLLGIMGGLFTFAVLYALVRGARRVALGAMATAVGMIAFLVLFNLAQAAPFTTLRDLPYIGRLGRVFETEGGTGQVRVLIWEGALKLVLPHTPLEWPTGGYDLLNPLRPLIGYGPETMYVAYNRFYPPDLGHLESRNATPDRSHDETFDALVTTGLIGFMAENLLFLSVFYFSLKWLGFINSPRERNVFIALWYVSGVLVALIFGQIMGWQFIGVAVPAGMITGFFAYLVGFALLRGSEVRLNQDPVRALMLVSLLSVVVSHFVEIHFGIAIVATRTLFWFVSALLVVVGTSQISEPSDSKVLIEEASSEQSAKAPLTSLSSRKKTRRGSKQRAFESRGSREDERRLYRSVGSERQTLLDSGRLAATRVRAEEVSTAPLIAFAFVTGLILATMGFDYITSNSVTSGASPVDVIISALTTKTTTLGTQTSYAMFWLFVGTLLVALGIGLADWGREVNLTSRDWLIAVGLFLALGVGVSATFIFFNVLLISTPGPGAFDATLSAFSLYLIFVLVAISVVATTLLFDYRLPAGLVSRASTWIVAPIVACAALAFVLIPNVSIAAVSVVQADIIYKDALSLANGTTLLQSIQRFQQALSMQPNQDYYLLFLGRSYLEYAKTVQDVAQRERVLGEAESALLQARNINPLQTDHTANLARLHEAWAPLEADPSTRLDHYKKSLDYYSIVIRMNPNTVHLYDQYAQAEIEYASFLKSQDEPTAAEEAMHAARAHVGQALAVDPDFCLSYGVRAQTQSDWRGEANDALDALRHAPTCGDVFVQEGRATGMQALVEAGDRATAAGEGAQYALMLEQEARVNPSVELFTALTNYYSTAGEIDRAVAAADGAISLIPESDPTTLQKYSDFRAGLNTLLKSITAAKAAPGDPEVHRTLAKAWLARGQIDFALPEYQRVSSILPGDYDAYRMVVLLLLQRDRIADALSVITKTLTLAPEAQHPFWQQLTSILGAAQSGQNAAALASLDALIKGVDPKDTVTIQALRTLSTKLRGSG